ncbi:putative phosphoesterase [Winogradskyella epiphytica]|uniref:Putative phosphoesterase n=1 Tax=Winogradskyella epiphytica TaxID=262005 RepID=A0A2V4XQU7_9FLAO|nr:ligase-associated DNA damage response endonuclease PdeM [Winogradskyella epiphytica]PYE80216.1 putative phosphoesterase [Winogradskyella epiphytica]GGW69823.1 DEAD/DEAH box helicase [Winogradskyella epiphytica]
METLKINCHQRSFVLHPSGAAYWEEKGMLLIADVHLGKVTHFRKHGSAIPQASLYQNFEKLQAVVDYFKPKSVCFLGDLFHSSINSEWHLFKDWIEQLQSEVVLISGNHDIISKSMFDGINVTVKEEWLIDDFLLTHYPESRDGLFNLSGHIHPGVRLKGFGKQFLKVSCFFRREQQLIFPAFGNFTGKFIVEPNSKDRIYVNTRDEVIEISAKLIALK